MDSDDHKAGRDRIRQNLFGRLDDAGGKPPQGDTPSNTTRYGTGWPRRRPPGWARGIQDQLRPVDRDDLPVYPFGEDDRIDGHFFISWEHRRWLNSDMRLKATPECRALYFDLICISFDQSPLGTLPDDVEILAAMLHVEASHLKALIQMEYGPLHRWEKCMCGDEVRLMHHHVLRILRNSIAPEIARLAEQQGAVE